jgi:hypothetical protein
MTTRGTLGVAPPTDGTGNLAQDGTRDSDRPPGPAPHSVPAAMRSPTRGVPGDGVDAHDP